MATLELSNMSDDLLQRLSRAAAVGHRDVAAEAVDRLDMSLRGQVPARSHEELSAMARAIRAGNDAQASDAPPSGAWLTPEFIRSARDWGRD